MSIEWVENLNTALDDNRVLCLASGERIRLLDTTKLLFEVSSLENTSPATVSRLGSAYFPKLGPESWQFVAKNFVVRRGRYRSLPAQVRQQPCGKFPFLLSAFVIRQQDAHIAHGRLLVPLEDGLVDGIEIGAVQEKLDHV